MLHAQLFAMLAIAGIRTDQLIRTTYSVALGPINTVTLRIIVGFGTIFISHHFHIHLSPSDHLQIIFRSPGSPSNHLGHLQTSAILAISPPDHSTDHSPNRSRCHQPAHPTGSQVGRDQANQQVSSTAVHSKITRRSLDDHSRTIRRSLVVQRVIRRPIERRSQRKAPRRARNWASWSHTHAQRERTP